MKRFHTPTTAVFAMLAAVAFGSAPALAAPKCDNPKGVAEQRACAIAAEGNEALRRFVERTRMIYSLYYFDFARDEPKVAASAASVQTASAGVAASPASH